jgi:hypothetical protein
LFIIKLKNTNTLWQIHLLAKAMIEQQEIIEQLQADVAELKGV